MSSLIYFFFYWQKVREKFFIKNPPKKQKNNCLILNFGSLTESSRNKKWERDQTTEIGLREKKVQVPQAS